MPIVTSLRHASGYVTAIYYYVIATQRAEHLFTAIALRHATH